MPTSQTRFPYRPLVVIVADGRWDAYAQDLIKSPSDIWLFQVLTEIGGINETVAPGRYHFNAKVDLGTQTTEISLEPAPE